jgi:hypothetical protein
MFSPLADSALDADGDHILPPYSATLGEISEDNGSLGTNAVVAEDGRVNIRIDQRTTGLANLLGKRVNQQLAGEKAPPPPYIPPSLGGQPGQIPPPPMNVVIQVVGSRGK